ncbi:hypothetical protein AB1N83_005400 [Pleurotus pulmonarius]
MKSSNFKRLVCNLIQLEERMPEPGAWLIPIFPPDGCLQCSRTSPTFWFKSAANLLMADDKLCCYMSGNASLSPPQHVVAIHRH